VVPFFYIGKWSDIYFRQTNLLEESLARNPHLDALGSLAGSRYVVICQGFPKAVSTTQRKTPSIQR
jgi:hypothetical protein